MGCCRHRPHIFLHIHGVRDGYQEPARGRGIHVYNELVADLQKENGDAIVFLEKRAFLPYKESILAITGYLKDLGLHKLGNKTALS